MNKKLLSKVLRHKIVFLLCLLFSPQISKAYDVKVDGIYYNLNTAERTAEVTNMPNTLSYSGRVRIPDLIIVNGIQYSIASIGAEAFSGCQINDVTIPSTVIAIDELAFFGCSELSSITIPNSVKSIGRQAFSYCGINSVVIPESVVEMGDKAFMGCDNLTSVFINNSFVGFGTFSNCKSLVEINFSQDVQTIDYSAFEFCEKLTEIIIPSSVTTIEDGAFVGCYSLTNVLSEIIVPFEISESVFDLISSNATLYVPKGTKSKYQAYSGWTANFKEIVEDDKSIGSESNPYTVPQAHTLIQSLGADVESDVICVKGFISQIDNILPYPETTYGNATYWISDVKGSTAGQLEVYRGYSIGSEKFSSKDEIKEGDEVVVKGKVVNYRGNTPEFTSGSIIYSLNGQASIGGDSDNIPGTLARPFTPAEANAFILQMEAGVNSTQDYYIKGKIIDIEDKNQFGTQYGNCTFYISDDGTDKDDKFYVYRTLYLGNEKYSDDSWPKPKAGDEVIICGKVVNYKGNTPETVQNQSYIYSLNGQTSIGGDSDTPGTLARPFTPAEANAFILQMEAGVNSTQDYYIKGKIIDIEDKNQFGTQYGNCTFYISDDGTDKDDKFYVYRTLYLGNKKYEDDSWTKPKAGDEVIICGKVVNYKGNTPETVQNQSYIYSLNGKTEIGEGDDITQFITATSLGGAITQTNNLINSGSQLNWNFSNKSTYKVLLKSLQLIDGQTGSWGNVMTIDQFVEAGTSVSYTTTIGSSGIHTPVTCHFIYDYNGTEYSVDAKFSSSLGNCTLSIESTGNGSITYNGTIIRNETKDFSVENGSAVTLTFTPDAGCQLLNVQEGNLNVASAVTNNSYLVMIIGNTTVSVTFSGVPTDISSEGMKYTVSSYNNKTVSLAKGNYGPVLKVPATIDAEGATWTVVGIDEGAFNESPYLAAIIWNPTVPFTETVSNPNLLLYVNDAEYAPSSVKNVVVNDKATSITLTDAANGNDFYCPREFTAEQISYTHRYEMTTGIEESRGWETIALPFDVDRVEHSTKGSVVPFASWNTSSVTKPFWLYQYGSGGFTEATVIRANTPYIISMPNNEQYLAAYRLNGTVTFSASNATVKATDEAITANNGDMSFVPCFSVRQAQTNDYALNVNNELASNSSTVVEGSRFIRNSRVVHPFEAYFTTSAQNARPFIPVFEDVPTGIKDVPLLGDRVQGNNVWYTLDGRKLKGKPVKSGVYINNGKKAVVR